MDISGRIDQIKSDIRARNAIMARNKATFSDEVNPDLDNPKEEGSTSSQSSFQYQLLMSRQKKIDRQREARKRVDDSEEERTVIEITDLQQFLEEDTNFIYHKDWITLHKSQKKERLNHFIEQHKEEWIGTYHDPSIIHAIRSSLDKALRRGWLNKNTEVRYCDQTGSVIDLPNFTFAIIQGKGGRELQTNYHNSESENRKTIYIPLESNQKSHTISGPSTGPIKVI